MYLYAVFTRTSSTCLCQRDHVGTIDHDDKELLTCNPLSYANCKIRFLVYQVTTKDGKRLLIEIVN